MSKKINWNEKSVNELLVKGNSKIGENVYYSLYTSQILDELNRNERYT